MASWANKGRALQRMSRIAPAVKAAVKVQTKENAEEMVAQVKRNMQIFEHPSGDLESTLTITDTSNQYRISYRITEGGGLEFYAPMVEFGHDNAEPKPHFWPAYRVNRRRFKTRTSAVAKLAIRAQAK